VVHPDTVVRWQRERFRRYWAQRSKKSGRRGRPPISRQVRELRTIDCANPLRHAPRIHGELRKLGIEVSERTVSRVLRTVKRPPPQTWKTFYRTTLGRSSPSASSLCRLSACGFCLCFSCWNISGGRYFISESLNIRVPNGPRCRWWINNYVRERINQSRVQ
jgi:hypothetical protein